MRFHPWFLASASAAAAIYSRVGELIVHFCHLHKDHPMMHVSITSID